MKMPTRPTRALLSSCHLESFLPFTLLDELCVNTIKYTKYYPREEYRRMPYFLFIPPHPWPNRVPIQFEQLLYFLTFFAVRPCLWYGNSHDIPYP